MFTNVSDYRSDPRSTLEYYIIDACLCVQPGDFTISCRAQHKTRHFRVHHELTPRARRQPRLRRATSRARRCRRCLRAPLRRAARSRSGCSRSTAWRTCSSTTCRTRSTEARRPRRAPSPGAPAAAAVRAALNRPQSPPLPLPKPHARLFLSNLASFSHPNPPPPFPSPRHPQRAVLHVRVDPLWNRLGRENVSVCDACGAVAN